jgi:hypothetical protein
MPLGCRSCFPLSSPYRGKGDLQPRWRNQIIVQSLHVPNREPRLYDPSKRYKIITLEVISVHVSRVWRAALVPPQPFLDPSILTCMCLRSRNTCSSRPPGYRDEVNL